MNWIEQKNELLTKLQNINHKLHAVSEINKLDNNTKFEIDKLNDLIKNSSKLLEKLKRNEFQIAVVGLEGSGKSTFINAMIESDFLPTHGGKRCTYSSVELCPISEKNLQYATISMKTISEFDDYIQQIETSITNPSEELKRIGILSLENELKEINEYRDEIYKYLVSESSEQKIPFENLSELKSIVEDYIVSPSKARAVKSIRILTKQLKLTSGDKELVFYDVPGYDSPLKFHKEQTERRLGEADLIIFVHSIYPRADLKDGQVTMMNLSDNLDKSISTKDKLFVFLNGGNRNENKKRFIENQQIAISEWTEKYKFASIDKIVTGSALGYLIEKGQWSDSDNEVLKKQKEFGLTSGIDELREKINQYLETERITVLQKVVNNFVSESNKIIQKVRETINEQYNFNVIEETGRAKYFEINKEFNNWWDKKWIEISEKFDKWYFDNILKSEQLDWNFEIHPKFKKIKEKHIADLKIDEWFLTDNEIDAQIRNDREAGFLMLEHSNMTLRKKLYNKCMNNVETASIRLSVHLEEITDEIFNWIFDNLYKQESIKKFLYNQISNSLDLKSVYKSAISALFIRHARPLIDIYIKAPKNSEDRNAIIRSRASEVKSLVAFVPDDFTNILFSQLENIIKIATNSEIIAETTTDIIDELVKPTVNNKDQLKKELKDDLNSILSFIKDPIFNAAGILAFCVQEIEKLRRNFKEYPNKYRDLLLDACQLGQIPELNNLEQKYNNSLEKILKMQSLYEKLNFSN